MGEEIGSGSLHTARLERGGARIGDFHLWLGPGHHGIVATLNAQKLLAPSAYRAMLASFPTPSHVTIEVETDA